MFEKFILKYKYSFTEKELEAYSNVVSNLFEIKDVYLPKKAYTGVRPFLDTLKWHPIIHNKWISVNYLRSLGINVPKTFGLLHKEHGYALSGQPLQSGKDLEELIISKDISSFVIKHIGGGVGSNVYIVKEIITKSSEIVYKLNNGVVLDSNTIDKILGIENGGLRGFLVEEKLELNREFEELTDSSFASIRLNTFKAKAGNIEIQHAFVRLGVAGALTDHSPKGGIMCPVDLEEGKILYGFDANQDEEITLHPTSKRELQDFKIPMWHEIKNEALKAAKTSPELNIVGWDIVPSNRGPVLLEGNVGFNMIIYQKLFDGFIKSGIYDKWSEHLGFNKDFQTIKWKLQHWYKGRQLNPLEKFLVSIFYKE